MKAHNTVLDVREQLADLYEREIFIRDKSGVKVVELINASFIADEDSIFGEVNHDYIDRELEWYKSMSLNVNDIPGKVPEIWKQVADKEGYINSNYGWCIFSEENNHQFYHAVTELENNPQSRRAIMIYTRPTMWGDHNKNGRSDFMCTNSVQYVARENAVHAIVNMRSNDAWAGYRNDFAWQKWVLDEFVSKLNARGFEYEAGNIFWNVGSLHVYERQFYLIDHYTRTGEISITKDKYAKLYEVA